MSKILVTLLIAVLCFDNTHPTKTDLITATPWKLTQVNTNGQSFSTPPCVVDNKFLYDKNGNYRVEEGALKCVTEDPDSIIGVWRFLNDETRIRIEYQWKKRTEVFMFEVVKLTAEKMELQIYEEDDRGVRKDKVKIMFFEAANP